jgi:hypothetical protein
MDGWAYFREICGRSLRWAWGIGHDIQLSLVCVGSLIIWCSVHFEHYALAITLPLGVISAFFLIGAGRQTFALYGEQRAHGQELHATLVREREQRAAEQAKRAASIRDSRTHVHTHKR